VSRICNNIRQLNTIINTGVSVRGEAFWSNILFPGFHLAPILHDILSIHKGRLTDDLWTRQRECFRLAASIYAAELRRFFGMDHIPATIYSAKLQTMLTSPGILPSWGRSNILLLWTLVVGASLPCVPQAMRSDFTDMLLTCVQVAGVSSFQELASLVSSFMWCDAALGPSLSALQYRLPSPLW